MSIYSLLTTAAGNAAPAATEAAKTASKITFEPKNFISMLGYMGKGMLVIFVIIGVIVLATMAINKVFSKKKN